MKTENELFREMLRIYSMMQSSLRYGHSSITRDQIYYQYLQLFKVIEWTLIGSPMRLYDFVDGIIYDSPDIDTSFNKATKIINQMMDIYCINPFSKKWSTYE